jgi:hypothetical protein
MYTQVWSKYLPILRILFKKSASAEQVFNLNISDFEKIGAARKAGYKFKIHFSKGRVDNVISASEMAKDLAATLLQDAVVKELFMQNDYTISMNTKFQLTISFIPNVSEEAVALVSEDEQA